MRFFASLLLLLMLSPAHALDRVVMQLNWKHQFQFAGYYAAIEKGYFRDAGFDVNLRELPDGGDPIASVLKGDAEYGVAASELAVARAQGKPVVALAAIVQHSPLVLLANRRQIPSIDALAGRRIMLAQHETELFAYLKQEGVGSYKVVPHSFDVADLIAGKVDAVSGYSTDEPFLLREVHFPYVMFTPDAVGIDFYGDTLFTSAQQVGESADKVRAFRKAALRGWSYAMDHPDEIADLILERYSKRHSREHLLFEANELRRLMQPQLVELGQMSASRWQKIAQTYADQGLLPAEHSLEGLIFPAEKPGLPGWVWPVFLAAAVIIMFAGMLAAHLARLNGRLKAEITTRHGVEKELRSSEERYRRLAEQSKDVIWTIDLASMRFTYISPAVERGRGFTAEEVMANPMSAAMTPESYERVKTIIDEHLTRISAGDRSALSAMTEIDQPHKHGGTIATEVVASFLLDDNGKPVTVLGVARDISQRRAVEDRLRAANDKLQNQLDEIQRLQAALQEQAIRDSLTGCFNRRYLDETLERELWRARREGYPLALLILDLDHFKQINDTYGHQAGDEALKEVARALQADTRHEDVLCRYGGEEFVILMPRMPLEIATQRAERWRQMIGSVCVRHGSIELNVTASIGLAAYPEHGKVPDELTQAADLALYLAKHQGRNRVVVYSPEV
jgi:diguanylate cyclase (GGDEF)-like protein/PAS domain S-box-containing protein